MLYSKDRNIRRLKPLGLPNPVFLLTAIIAIILVLSGCAGGPQQYLDSQNTQSPSDKVFHETLLKAMPGLELTSAIMGKPFIPSPAFSMQVGRPVSARPTGPLEDFLKEFEDSGAKPAVVYFSDFKSGRPISWKARFAGCSPGQCRKQASITPLEKASILDWERYASSSETSLDGITIARQEINGVNYFAHLQVSYDFRGRVRAYDVVSYRDALTARERRVMAQFDGSLRGIPVFQYGKIIPLGVEASTFAPRPNSMIDTRKEI